MREEKSFGLTMAVVFGALTLIATWRQHQRFTIAFGALGAAFLLLLILAPRLLVPVRSVWMRLARFWGALNARIVMTIFYFLVIVPLGVTMRVFGRDLMRRTWHARPASMWEDYRPRQHDPRHYENMF